MKENIRREPGLPMRIWIVEVVAYCRFQEVSLAKLDKQSTQSPAGIWSEGFLIWVVKSIRWDLFRVPPVSVTWSLDLKRVIVVIEDLLNFCACMIKETIRFDGKGKIDILLMKCSPTRYSQSKLSDSTSIVVWGSIYSTSRIGDASRIRFRKHRQQLPWDRVLEIREFVEICRYDIADRKLDNCECTCYSRYSLSSLCCIYFA
jgi:hypothetical protein